MATTGFVVPTIDVKSEMIHHILDKNGHSQTSIEHARPPSESVEDEGTTRNDGTHRRLKARHVQLIGIGGTIGTALFVQIGRALLDGGPGNLVLAFSIWCTFVLAITVSIAEIVCFNPISSPFIRFAGRYVGDAFGVATGWNYFIFEAVLVPYEIVSCHFIIKFWDNQDTMKIGATLAIVLLLYTFINFLGVKNYGEVEFWASIGKVFLIIAMIIFTFVTMLGGNPLHDRFMFRYWRDPGAFKEYYTDGATGRFLGFLQCFIQATFMITGPDYVAIVAGETENPRVTLPHTFKQVFYRLTSFFILGSMSVGVLVPHNDAGLKAAFGQNLPGAAASPYVLAMARLKIPVLPHLMNAMILMTSFSAGNSYVYCASRSLYGLALEGKAPAIFMKCNRKGVPIYSVAVVMLISLSAFLQLSSGSAKVLQLFISLVTASQLINFWAMSITFLCYYRACRTHRFDRNNLPFRSWGQPYTAIYACVGTSTMLFASGYENFLPHSWNITSFLFSYTMIFVFIATYLSWRFFKGTKTPKPEEINLHQDIDKIEEYEAQYMPCKQP